MLLGRLGRDPETRFTQGGQAVCNFSIATDESFKDKNGEKQKRTEWHKIVVWGKQAEIAQKYLVKGSQLFLEGKIQTRKWQNKDGVDQASFEIVCSNFKMMGSPANGNGDRQHSEPAEQHHEQEVASPVEITDDDIPF